MIDFLFILVLREKIDEMGYTILEFNYTDKFLLRNINFANVKIVLSKCITSWADIPTHCYCLRKLVRF